jgi:Holliday junction resolvasome RuvABC endonuclease subunit
LFGLHCRFGDVQGVPLRQERESFTNPNPMTKTILGIDPGTREMGIAVLRAGKLLAYGVHTLRNGRRPHDLIGEARSVVFGYVDRFRPDVVGIEQPLLKPTKRAALVSVIAQELHERSRELGMGVVEISPREVRRRLNGNPHMRKIDVARTLAERFPELRKKVPVPPKRSALGFRPRDKYWLHMFDALAVAIAACEHPFA